MERTEHSFIKNAKERKERNVLYKRTQKNGRFFWKERMPNPEKNPDQSGSGSETLLKRRIQINHLENLHHNTVALNGTIRYNYDMSEQISTSPMPHLKSIQVSHTELLRNCCLGRTHKPVIHITLCHEQDHAEVRLFWECKIPISTVLYMYSYMCCITLRSRGLCDIWLRDVLPTTQATVSD